MITFDELKDNRKKVVDKVIYRQQKLENQELPINCGIKNSQDFVDLIEESKKQNFDDSVFIKSFNKMVAE